MANSIFEIPLKVGVPQSFNSTLGGHRYSITIQYRDDPMGGWVIDIYDADTQAPVLTGIPMVTGVNLLEQYAYLGFGGGLWVQTSHHEALNPDNVPTFENLGRDGLLYWVTVP